MAFRAVLGSQQLLRRRPTLLLPTRVPPTARRPIASNAVAPAFGYQNQLDLSADVREEEAESQSGKGGGGPSSVKEEEEEEEGRNLREDRRGTAP